MGVGPLQMSLPAGLATVIGALPQLSARDAAAMVTQFVPDLPAAPTVVLEAEAAELLAGTAGYVSDRDAESLAGARAFLESLRGRVDPVVMSLTGPVTVGLRLLGAGVSGDEASRLARDYVEEWAGVILDMAAQVLPDAPVMLFFEEPGLSNSMHPTFPMSPAAIDRLVGGVVEAIAERAFVGIQVSGRADWGLLVRTGIRVLGAPISARLDSAAADLQRFFDEGGFIAWGAVPVDEPLGPNSDRLWRRLSEIWAELAMAGLDPLQLRERSIITPAANLHAFGASQTERVLRLTNELSQRVFHQVTGAR
ncbi:MAG: hypothetical protein KDB20_07235, partial [Microthrixaceae bacterium]|nr:hypothetical protein [Microthrixaceae bacterium]